MRGRLNQALKVPAHGGFIFTTFGGQDPTAVDGGILMIDAGREGKDEKEFIGNEKISVEPAPIEW
jgi:hypothetical protein